MIRRFVLALAGAVLLASCGGPSHEWPAPKPALWEVSGPDGQHGWLFGTIHTLPADVTWRDAALDKALADSDVLVVEIADLGNANRAAGVFDRLAEGEGQPPLLQRVPEKDRPALKAFLDRADIGEDSFNDTDTWGAALVLANRARGFDRTQSVDRELIDQAGAGNVLGLESFAVQYGIFDGLPAKEQVDLLMALAKDAGGEDARIDAWLTGDLATLEKSGQAILEDPELVAALQVNRNRKWAPEIEAVLKGGQHPFVAVGTAHMMGDQSLPALLEKAGYTVKRIQ
jgi:hypothetical protein